MTGAEIAIQLLAVLLQHAGDITALLQRAQAEGRDVSEAEINGLIAADDTARTVLVAAIAKRRGQEA